MKCFAVGLTGFASVSGAENVIVCNPVSGGSESGSDWECKRECDDACDVNQTEASSVPAMVTITSSMMSALQSKKSLP